MPPTCDRCGGLLKPATISFGQSLDQLTMVRAMQAADACDFVIALGSTLSVYPAANCVPRAKAAGARVIIVNGGPTEMDRYADHLLPGSISSILPALVR